MRVFAFDRKRHDTEFVKGERVIGNHGWGTFINFGEANGRKHAWITPDQFKHEEHSARWSNAEDVMSERDYNSGIKTEYTYRAACGTCDWEGENSHLDRPDADADLLAHLKKKHPRKGD